MSLHLEFEPHSWYRGFAIKKPTNGFPTWLWTAFGENGNTYRVVELEAKTLEKLKQEITDWHERQNAKDLENRRRIGEKI